MRRTILALLALAILALAQFSASVPAQALLCGVNMNGTCFAIATGNLNAGATWSNTSGGATCSATCTAGPTAGDTLVLDSASGNITVTINVSLSVAVLDESGGSGGSGSPFTGTLSHGAFTLSVSGATFTLSAGSTYTIISSSTSLLNFTATSGTTTITPNGQILGPITFNGVGGTFSLGGDLQTCGEYVGGTSVGACVVTLTNGTFNANNHNVKVGGFASSNTNTRVLTMGSGTWTIGYNSSWNLATTTGLTVNFNTAPIVMNGAFIANGTTFAGGGLSYPNTVTFGPSTVGGVVSVTGANTFATLVLSAPVSVSFPNSITNTITNAINWAGTSTNQIMIDSSNVVARATLAVASGSVISWAAIRGIAFTGTTVNATNSFDLKNNSGVTITAPSTGGGGGVIGGYLLRRDLTPASNDNRPIGLPAVA